MKPQSDLFDKIRIRPDQETLNRGRFPVCEWPGCAGVGEHRAPKGRQHEGEYHHLCLDHVRLYNKSYNYFAGMPDEVITAYQKDSMTGHRPTWKVGVGRKGREDAGGSGPSHGGWQGPYHDPFNLFSGAGTAAEPPPETYRRKLKPLELKSLTTLDLEETASGPEIKARYKALVKRFHPDANGGDRGLEERLREIIQAYNYLKSAGFC